MPEPSLVWRRQEDKMGARSTTKISKEENSGING